MDFISIKAVFFGPENTEPCATRYILHRQNFFFLHFTHQVSLALTGSTTQPVETALYCQLVCVRTTTNLDAVVMPGLSLGHKNTEFLSIIFSIWLYTDIRISLKKASLFIKCHRTSYLFDLVDFYTKRPFMIPQRDFFPAKTEPAGEYVNHYTMKKTKWQWDKDGSLRNAHSNFQYRSTPTYCSFTS